LPGGNLNNIPCRFYHVFTPFCDCIGDQQLKSLVGVLPM